MKSILSIVNLFCFLFCFLFSFLFPTVLSLSVTPADLDSIVRLTILRGTNLGTNNLTINAIDDLKRRLKDRDLVVPSCHVLKETFPDLIPDDSSHRLCSEFVETCPSTSHLVQLSSGSKSLSETIQKICPILLFEPLCKPFKPEVDTSKKPKTDEVDTSKKPTTGEIWAWAILSVTIISCTSLVGVVIVPFLNKKSYQNVINLFEGLAVGSLTGSAIFHLIPQSFNLLTSESKHDYLWKTMVIFCGIYLFYWSERIMNIIVQVKDSGKDGVDSIEMNGKMIPQCESTQSGTVDLVEKSKSRTLEERIRSTSESLAPETHLGHHHHHQKGQKIATVAWMIIFGDGLHNFIDGLSIGAAFSENILTGISICLAVVCEEFPHELGDFAVLIASGMSIKQAVGYNFLSACTWYVSICY